MAIENRAAGYVKRADAALADLPNAADIWADTIRSSTDEMRLHSLAVALDNAIRKVPGRFAAWAELDPALVDSVAEQGPINLVWVISAHPSGLVREAFVHAANELSDDHILPHLANRAIDFVPAIRHVAGPMVLSRLAKTLESRRGAGEPQGVLPTSTHIAVKKMLAPRTAVLDPVLLHTCIALAETSSLSRPGAVHAANLDKTLQRCRQSSAASSDPAAKEALEALISYFADNTIPTRQPETQ